MNLLDVFNNLLLSILLVMTFTFFTFHFTRDIPKEFMESVKGKLFLSCFGFIISFFILHYAIVVPDTVTVIDLFPLILLTFYYLGGNVPTIVIAFAQIILDIATNGFDLGTTHAIIRSVLFLLVFNIVDYIIPDKKRWSNWYLKLILMLLISTPSLLYLLKDSQYNVSILLRDFTVTVTLAASLQYYLLESVRKSNELYYIYKQDATVDFLTGLLNTRGFDAFFHNSITQAKENNLVLSCLMIDIDFFKKINDTYGHLKGDIVLKEIASILNDEFGPIGTIGRIGGEEFCVILTNCSLKTALEAANKFRLRVQSHVFRMSTFTTINVTVSLGASNYPETTMDPSKLKPLADNALYDAKHSGRNKVCSSLSEF